MNIQSWVKSYHKVPDRRFGKWGKGTISITFGTDLSGSQATISIKQAFKVAVIKPLLIHYVIQLLGNYRSISMLCPGLAVSMKKGQNNKQN